MQYEELYEENDGVCDPGDTSCNWLSPSPGPEEIGDDESTLDYGDSGGHCNNAPDCLNMDDDVIVPDCWHSRTCKEEWANNVGSFAMLLDDIAAISNGLYAVVGDLVIVICPICEVGVLGVYQFYSFIPNTISTFSMGLWFMQGVLTGENNFSYRTSSEGTSWSMSVSQDTIIAVATNALGWTVLKEPNLAFGVDVAVAGYDHARAGAIPFINYALPSWINPTLSYDTSTGIDFSWR